MRVAFLGMHDQLIGIKNSIDWSSCKLMFLKWLLKFTNDLLFFHFNFYICIANRQNKIYIVSRYNKSFA